MVVVGAGIVGLTAAWVLAKAGLDVTVLEAARVARGVTARSTAKVTSQHGLALGRIAERHGEARARDVRRSERGGCGVDSGDRPALRHRMRSRSRATRTRT